MPQEITGPAHDWSLAKPGERRSLLLCASGAIIGLLIAGFGLFTAEGTRTSNVPAEDVALVNNVPILLSDFDLQLKALYDVPLSQATPDQKRKVLDDMIREELYVQRGFELGLQADTTEIRTALVGAVESQAAIDATVAQPEESVLRQFYEAHREKYADEPTLTLDDYIVPDPARAPAVVTALRAAHASPAAIAAAGLRRTKLMTNGEEYHFAARIHLGARLFDAVRTLDAGDVSKPVQLPDGVHVAVVKNNIIPPPRPFEQVRDRVLEDYINAQSKILLTGNDRFLRKRADILIQKGFAP
jgi:parvulin-like peptidyl-prolyl isomerase